MKTFLAVFNAFPAVLQIVQAVEIAVPMPKSGQQKLDMVTGAATAAWEFGQVGQQINKANWVSAVIAMTNIAVAGLNTVGVFSNSPHTTTTPVSSN